MIIQSQQQNVIRAVFIALLTLSCSATAAETERLEELQTLVKQGKYSDAEAQARALLEDVASSSGSDSVEAARVLDVLVESRWRGRKAREPETLELARRAIDIKERRLGANDLELAESLNNLAVIFFFIGEYGQARTEWERALGIRESVSGPNDPDVAQLLNNLGNLLQKTGEYGEARGLYERALAIREASFDPGHPLIGQSLHNLAVVLRVLGDYTEALPLAQRALETKEKAVGPDHPAISSSLVALGTCHSLTGNYEESLRLFERALSTSEKALGPEHRDVGVSLNNIAETLRNTGRYDEARPRYERALAIWEKAYGPDHPQVAVVLSSLGSLTESMGDYAEAKRFQARALAIRETAIREAKLDPQHPLLATSQTRMGILFARTGDYEQARPLLEQAVEIRSASLGKDHPFLAESMEGLAAVLAATGQATKAAELALEAEAIAREHLRLTGRELSEQHALHYAAIRSRGLDLALELATKLPSIEWYRIFDALVRSRAVVLDEMAARSRAVVSAADPKIGVLAENLAAARTRLANLTVRGVGSLSPQRYRELLKQARVDKDNAERTLAAASTAFSAEQQRSLLGIDEVAQAIPPGAALVSYAVFKPLQLPAATPAGTENAGVRELDEAAYIAFVLKSGRRDPVAVGLGKVSEVNALVSNWKVEASTGPYAHQTTKAAETAYFEASRDLRRVIWDPLATALTGVERVFVVPDGALNLVALAALPADEQSYLIERGPVLHYLSAERDLVPPVDKKTNSGLLAMGGPDYDRTIVVTDSPTSPSLPVAKTRGSTCLSFDSLEFKPLPNSKREVDEVELLWNKAADDMGDRLGISNKLTGPAASESAFKQQAPRHRVLHLATHGFFLGGECPSSEGSRGFGGLARVESSPPPVDPSATTASPLLRSGLALAGANRRSELQSGEDGILTAEEIATLDLRGVEWAVLSACDTGVGDIQPGEGVFGLRRAAQVAGVHTLIMSLWPVDDESTRDWMTALYRGRLMQAKDTADAVRAAGLNVLSERRDAGETSHPFYWAAFVAAGDWH